MFERILIAYDGSEGAEAALRLGIALGKALRAEVHSISVEEHLPYYAASLSEVKATKEQVDEYFRRLIKHARDQAAMQGVELEAAVRQGHEIEEIVRMAREGNFDLLVLGYHGHSRLVERVIGSTAQSISREAPCSVLLAK